MLGFNGSTHLFWNLVLPVVELIRPPYLFCIASSTSFISYSMLMILFSLTTITISSSVALFDIFTQNSPPRIEVLLATFLVFKPPLPQHDSFSVRPSMLATFLHGLNSLISNRYPLLWLSLSIFPPLVPCLQISLYTVLLLVPCNTWPSLVLTLLIQ